MSVPGGLDGVVEGHDGRSLPTVSYTLRVNGVDMAVHDAWLGETLLHVLRERLGLAGVKHGCGVGDCGACTVLIDARVAAACLVPAVSAQGRDIRTVEGLTSGADELPDRVRRALGATMPYGCGVCMPGLVVTACALLARNGKPSEPAVREALTGNLCRCVAAGRIVAALRGVFDDEGAAE